MKLDTFLAILFCVNMGYVCGDFLFGVFNWFNLLAAAFCVDGFARFYIKIFRSKEMRK